MIHQHEIAAQVAARVNEACQVFTATACLSGDQDGQVVLGCLLGFLRSTCMTALLPMGSFARCRLGTGVFFLLLRIQAPG